MALLAPPPGDVYDKDDETPNRGLNLGKLEGIGDGPVKSKDKSLKSKAPFELKADEENSKKRGRAGGAGIAVAETPLGPETPVGKLQQLKAKLKLSGAQKKKAAIGGGVTGGIIGIIAFVLFSLIPLKIEHIINDLENHFFASSHNALKNEEDRLFQNYAKRILKARKACGPTAVIDKNCAPDLFATGKTNPISNLYRAWKQGNLEDKLANDYGIELKYDPGSNTYYMKAPGMNDPIHEGAISDATINSDTADIFSDPAFRSVNKQEIRDTVRASFQNETLWQRVNMRFKVGRLLEEKYGIRRCIAFCKVGDTVDDLAKNINAQKDAAKLFVIDRVITPRNKALGDAIKCLVVSDLINGDNKCTILQNKTNQTCTDGVDCEVQGEPVSAEETNLSSELDTLAAEGEAAAVAGDEAATLTDAQSVIADAGGESAAEIADVVTPALDEAGSTLAADTTEGSIPFADIYAAIQIARQALDTLQKVSAANGFVNHLKKWIFVTNSIDSVAMFNLYRSYSDEVKSGHANANEVGSFVGSLGPGDQNSIYCQKSAKAGGGACPQDQEKGGTATAESTPLYQNLIENTQPITSTQSSLTDVLLPTAYAATTCSNGWPIPAGQTTCPPNAANNSSYSSSNYFCNSGKTIAQSYPANSNEKVCPEEKLGACTSLTQAGHGVVSGACTVFSSIATFIQNDPFFSVIFTLLNWFNATVGHVFNIINGVVNWLFGLIGGFLNLACGSVTKYATDALYAPMPVCEIYNGGQTYVKAAINAILNYIANWLIPNPVGTNMSGGRAFDTMASGADVSGNEYAHHGLGGVELTPQQSTAILNEENNYNMEQFHHQSFFARMFDTSNSYSLVSKLAVAMPSNLGFTTLQSSVASLLSNPLGIFSHSLASFISPLRPTVGAAANTDLADPFGVTQYGYPAQDIPTDPQKFWSDNCADYTPNAPGALTNNYNSRANNGANNFDPNYLDGSSVPVNPQGIGQPFDGTDPCLLIQAAVGSSGAVYDQTLLTNDDLLDSTGTAATGPANKNIYIVGDSLGYGMDTLGNLRSDLTASGWTVTNPNSPNGIGTVGHTTAQGIAQVQTDQALVKNSGTVIVELGTNNCSFAGAPSCDAAGFQADQATMIKDIKAINPTVQIQWMNVYSNKAGAAPALSSLNGVIASQAGAQGYKVIDWASQAANGGYTFDSALGVHPSDYSKMATWFAGQIGAATGLSQPNHPNVVLQALAQENPPKQTSILSSIWHKITVVSKVAQTPFKEFDVLWSVK